MFESGCGLRGAVHLGARLKASQSFEIGGGSRPSTKQNAKHKHVTLDEAKPSITLDGIIFHLKND